MQVVDEGTAAQVQEILARPTVAGAPALPVPHVRQGMFDGDPLAQLGAAGRRPLTLAQLLEELFVGVDMDATATRAGRAAHAQAAANLLSL